MRAIREFSSPLIRSGHMPNDFLSEVRILFPPPQILKGKESRLSGSFSYREVPNCLGFFRIVSRGVCSLGECAAGRSARSSP